MKRNTFMVRVGESASLQVVRTYEIPEASCAEEAADAIERAMAQHKERIQYGELARLAVDMVKRIPEMIHTEIKQALEIDESKAATLEECVSDVLLDEDALADKIAARVGDRIAKALEVKRPATFNAEKFEINCEPQKMADVSKNGPPQIWFYTRSKIYDQVKRLEALAEVVAENKDGDTASEILHRQERIAQAMNASGGSGRLTRRAPSTCASWTPRARSAAATRASATGSRRLASSVNP